ncbi:MAG: phytanoyl-CoA dioxygenase family protein [Pseudomonadales bacterium]
MTQTNPQDPRSALRRDAEAFAADGYLVVPGLCPPALCEALAADVRASLHPVLAPAEFEADVGYPGAPQSRSETGGDTPRRLLNAYARFPALRPLVTGRALGSRLAALLGTPEVRLSQCHHNCVMTKAPDFSSVTLWHQDIRYWSFERPELVSLWVALGPETADNGALQVIPGSHRQAFTAERLDDVKFLRPELPENQALIAQARTITLQPGDALLFHCRLFHAAGRNLTDRVKLSCVFTYHAADNAPLPGTRSAQYASIAVDTHGG